MKTNRNIWITAFAIFFLLIYSCLFFYSCSGNKASKENNNMLAGTWELENVKFNDWKPIKPDYEFTKSTWSLILNGDRTGSVQYPEILYPHQFSYFVN